MTVAVVEDCSNSNGRYVDSWTEPGNKGAGPVLGGAYNGH